MNNTNDVLIQLMQILEDGTAGLTDAARRLDELSYTAQAGTLRELAQQRIAFHAEMKIVAEELGYNPPEAGTIVAKLHRGWMSIKDRLSGESPDGILEVAEQGEHHTVSVYEKMATQDIPERLRAAIVAQLAELRSAHETIKALLASR